MQLRKISNDSGVVLIIVIIIIFLMSIVCATIFSQSMSQTKTARAQVDAIVAEELAKGFYWKNYEQMYDPNFVDSSGAKSGRWNDFVSICPISTSCPVTPTANGLTFSTVISIDASKTPPVISAKVSY